MSEEACNRIMEGITRIDRGPQGSDRIHEEGQKILYDRQMVILREGFSGSDAPHSRKLVQVRTHGIMLLRQVTHPHQNHGMVHAQKASKIVA